MRDGALRVVYRLAVAAAEGRRRAEALAHEQTVELAPGRVPAAGEPALGRVREVVPHPEGGVRATIDYPEAAVANDPAQLLNVAFGNASLQDDVTLEGLDPGAALLRVLGGPGFGTSGLRAVTGVREGPLTCAALKPMGASSEALAERCVALARAGIDVIKDDHGLADPRQCPFERRVAACLDAVEAAADATGRRAVYAPNLIGGPATLRRHLDAATAAGAGAVLVAPLVVGLPAFHEIARRSPVPVLAHPAWAGGARVRPELLLGTVFRLYGADAVVFPHAGGRFPFDAATCRELADRMRSPRENLMPTLPVPAGGMTLERITELVGFYGSDAMLLVGGTLYADAEGAAAWTDRARTFVERVRESWMAHEVDAAGAER